MVALIYLQLHVKMINTVTIILLWLSLLHKVRKKGTQVDACVCGRVCICMYVCACLRAYMCVCMCMCLRTWRHTLYMCTTVYVYIDITTIFNPHWWHIPAIATVGITFYRCSHKRITCIYYYSVISRHLLAVLLLDPLV